MQEAIGNHLSLNPAPNSWAANRDHEVAIWVVEMEPGAEWSLLPAGKGVNRTLYFFEGDTLLLNGSNFGEHCAIELEAHLEAHLENGSLKGRFLVLQGAPINETVVNYGPFVMNTQEEIQQTFADYQKTRFGGWPWPKDDQVHGREPGKVCKVYRWN